jgi:hypothetical protein
VGHNAMPLQGPTSAELIGLDRLQLKKARYEPAGPGSAIAVSRWQCPLRLRERVCSSRGGRRLRENGRPRLRAQRGGTGCKQAAWPSSADLQNEWDLDRFLQGHEGGDPGDLALVHQQSGPTWRSSNPETTRPPILPFAPSPNTRGASVAGVMRRAATRGAEAAQRGSNVSGSLTLGLRSRRGASRSTAFGGAGFAK